jgi:phosphoribosylformylglycinamidine cyclo-ligase
MDRHDTVGIDLVAMCVNDIAVSGAEPLFFLDYFATGKLSIGTAESVVKGIAEGCRQAGCALIGGETAEMPSFYPDGEYDLAGFAVGVVDRPKIIDGRHIVPGDAMIGLASTGVHSNGLSLARKVLLEQGGSDIGSRLPEFNASVGETLLTPTRIYAKQILTLAREFNLKGAAHITGGGITNNLPRVLPAHCGALIRRGSWPVLPVFQVIQERGGVAVEEMYRVFNMGIGLIVITPIEQAEAVIKRAGELGDRAYRIGEIAAEQSEEGSVQYVG